MVFYPGYVLRKAYVYDSRRQQELEVGLEDNPALMSELRALRLRKDELESHLTSLQDSRRHLMVQLEGLMKLLKVCFLTTFLCVHF